MYRRALRQLVRRPTTSQPRPLRLARYRNTQSSEADYPIIQKVHVEDKELRWKERKEVKARECLSAKTSKPLRILFCGSDDFSAASLRGLHEEQKRNPQLIASIDVLCRPGKPSGRNLKIIREVPIKAVAEELGLPVHERDTFTGWDLPKLQDEPINLIIAVSFGLFVPPRILKSAEYGGLNVHPSLLPNLRGPAPLQHTIMSGMKYCGVTLQTLDEESFDHGIILAQSRPNGYALPSGNKCTYQDLLKFISPIAAGMLVEGVRDRLFVPLLVDVGLIRHTEKLLRAPKIDAADKFLNWREHSVTTMDRKYRALGRLWCHLQLGAEKKRVAFEDLEMVPIPEVLSKFLEIHKGHKYGVMKLHGEEEGIVRFMLVCHNEDLKPRFYVVDGDAVIIVGQFGALRVKEITVEGKGKHSAALVLQRLGDWKEWRIKRHDYKVTAERIGEGHKQNLTNKMVVKRTKPVIEAGVEDEVTDNRMKEIPEEQSSPALGRIDGESDVEEIREKQLDSPGKGIGREPSKEDAQEKLQ